MGKGLFAKKTIPKGTIVCFVCDNCKIFSQTEVKKMSIRKRNFILNHAWRDSNGKLVLQCRNTIYFNHSCNASVLDSGGGFDIVVRTIKKGEEATYDYRSFHQKENDFMICGCGERNCCKIVRWMHPIPRQLRIFWQKKIDSALKLTEKINQPLKDKLLKKSNTYQRFLKK